jgi:hypothetical protein
MASSPLSLQDIFVGRDRDVGCTHSYHRLVDAHGKSRNVVCMHQVGESPFDAIPNGCARVTHVTSLSTAYEILRTSFRAGPATDRSKTGVFCIGDNLTLGHAFHHARDRAKCSLCTEWVRHGEPSSWSQAVVLVFYPIAGELTKLGRIGASRKCVLECTPGTYLCRGRIDLWVEVDQWHAWVQMHSSWEARISGEFARHETVMCGGKQSDALYWARDSNYMPASCGRTARIADLYDDNPMGWRWAGNRPVVDRIYRCPLCHSE